MARGWETPPLHIDRMSVVFFYKNFRCFHVSEKYIVVSDTLFERLYTMRKSITRFSLVVAVTCVCNGVLAQTPVGKWNTTNAFAHKKGTERVKVQVTSRENEYIAVTYKLPEVACKTIQSRGAVREMERQSKTHRIIELFI